MINPLKTAANLAVLCLTLACPVRAQHSLQNECASLQNARLPDLVQFLNGVAPDEKNGDCITWAINKLGEERYKPSITVLIKFLDFRRPPTQREKQGIYLRMQGVWEIYPAAGALSLIGRKALPEVLQTIESDSTTATAKENAVFVWMETYRDTDEHLRAIAILKQEESQSSDEKVRQRLRWATRRALSWCNPIEEKACQAAASGSGS
jgi:hypothetical protein